MLPHEAGTHRRRHDGARRLGAQPPDEVRVARAEPADDAIRVRKVRLAGAGEHRVETQRLERARGIGLAERHEQLREVPLRSDGDAAAHTQGGTLPDIAVGPDGLPVVSWESFVGDNGVIGVGRARPL